MRVYVATKWSRRQEAAALMATLREMGHEITHDWTTLDGEPPGEDDLSGYFARCAASDVDGVLDADAMVLLHDPGCRGAFVELGIALAQGVKVVVVDGEGHPEFTVPIFYFLPEIAHVATPGEAANLIHALEAA